MKRVKLVLIFCALISTNLWAGGNDAEKAAVQWLELLDKSNHEMSWKQMAPLFQKGLSKDDWRASLKGLRMTFGKTNSRKKLNFVSHKILPGAAPGNYADVSFKTRFDNATMTETVTLGKIGEDWKVFGFSIQ